MAAPIAFPWDGRDQEDQVEARYNDPLRAQNKFLEDENMRLKRLLRENGISWSPSITFSPTAPNFSAGMPHALGIISTAGSGSEQREVRRRKTRSSVAALQVQRVKVPHLPMEVQLRILQYALVSPHPIIDPLSKMRRENQTAVENQRHNQIAIHALAACRAFHAEGTRIFWASNQFTFTTHQALRNFANLDPSFRRRVRHVNLRIIARYYDDQKRTHYLTRDYHPDLKRDIVLRVAPRLKEDNLTRKGFRCYTWCQTIDFLDALRPPFDPKHNKKQPRPRLLPGLETMRIDFVNFPEYFLPFSETDLHEMAAHDLGCSLNELIVTGLPCCEVGMKAGCELSGMVKDDGLFLDGGAAYVQTKTSMRELAGRGFAAKVVRPWRKLLKEEASPSKPSPGHSHDHSLPDLPPAPEEPGHPISTWKKRKSLWKRVPITRDSEERKWVEFDRRSGLPVDDLTEMWGGEDSDFDSDDEPHVCAKCGEFHGQFDPDDW